ncbi:SafA/ExsA family spore coat assembly protein [Pseudoneobacillus rhizosphaerae]|uniref:SafA/ExsA family spore coat assembly protein n=1 Tax=Pseudoneobacillus rhizosphaerae TaxID=2880968 RepID=A0A9C7G9C2_9BACI|nr:SafA/ExsA family spore coat assembly protein [Pseudoneobacillus rhizosphaerae]CAG9607957.1 hypothetical protein NEOCIP111885_01649 [Pseudoneobacillus rhizosphaerae]
MKIHIVQKGDTLWKIAKKYGVNFEELKKMNSQLSNPDMIMPGMKIKVPTTGGSVKKEAPILGAKKEMPIAQHPIVKEQPKPLPVVEAPKKEAPIKEAPIMPIKEAPIAPIMPQPVIPDIDINNYYMLNMAQMNVQQPQLPPKPTNILPEVKEAPKKEAPIVEAPKKEAPIVEAPKKEAPIKEAPIKEIPIKEIPQVESPIEQPIVQEYCVPVSPILPGSGLFPGWCPPPPCPPSMPYQPQVMPYEQFPGDMNLGMLPGVENPTYLADMDESDDFMPQMPLTNPMAQNPTAVMGVEDFSQESPMGMEPGGFGPMADNCFPSSPVFPEAGVGYGGGFPGVPFGGQQMPFQQQPFGGQQMPFQQPYGGQQMPFQQQPFGGQQMPFQQQPYGGQQMPFQQPYVGQQMPFQPQPYGGQQMPFQQPYGGQQMPFQPQPYGGQQMPFQQMPYVGRQMDMQQQMPLEDENQMEMQQMPFGNQQMMQQMPYDQQFGGQQMPYDQQQFGGQQMPYDQQQFGGQQMPYDQQQFGGQQMPFQQQQFGGQQMPYESPEFMMQGPGVIPEQMGMPFNAPHMSPGGFNYDCGCGGPKIQPRAPINPYGQGTPGIYTPPFGSQMGQQRPFMNPYGYGPSPGSDRGFDESSEFY